MRLLLTLGTTQHKSIIGVDHTSPRSTVALHLRAPSEADLVSDANEPYNISLDSLFIARSNSEPNATAMYAEWHAILTGRRHGFDLSSLLVLSAQMAQTSTPARRGLNRGGITFNTKKELVRETIAAVMPCLVSLLTVELARGRGLDNAGLAPTFVVYGYDAFGFDRLSHPEEEWDYDKRRIHQSDPELTRQTYNALSAVEWAVDGIEDTSDDPLLRNPYAVRPRSVLHMPPASAGGADAHAPTSSDGGSQSRTGANVPTSFLIRNARVFMHPGTNAEKVEALRSALWARMPKRELPGVPEHMQRAHRVLADMGLEHLSWAARDLSLGSTFLDEIGDQMGASGQNPDEQD